MGGRTSKLIAATTIALAVALLGAALTTGVQNAHAAAASICVIKIIDADGNPGTTGDQTPGPGFTIDIVVTPPDFSTPSSADTGLGGCAGGGAASASFSVDLGVDGSALVTVSEPGETGYTPISAECRDPGNVPIGSPSASQVKNVPLTSPAAYTCTFYNAPAGAPTPTPPPGGSADAKITAQSSSGPPSVNAGVIFPIVVNKTIHNNGPTSPASIRITPIVSGPSDCTITPDPSNPSVVTIASSTPANVIERFNVSCSQPSTHVFTVTNCVRPLAPLVDPNPANDCFPVQSVTVVITALSDLKLSSVGISAPPSVGVGAPFSVTGTPVVHNNGPFGPVAVRTSVSLVLPPGCTTSSLNPQTVGGSAPVSVATSQPPGTWSVVCTNPSNHIFRVTGSVAVNQLHVNDPNGANNGNTSPNATVAVIANADVKVTAVSQSGPPSATAGSTFGIASTATLHNNGPFGPVNTDLTMFLLLPPDCISLGPNPVTVQNVSLATSTPSSPAASFSIQCTDPSAHQFRTSASVVVDQLHVQDTNSINNSVTSGNLGVAINAQADVKVMGATVFSPPSAAASVTFPVSVLTGLHNNGPLAQVNVRSTVTLILPPDCTTPDPNPVTVGQTLPISSAVQFSLAWNVTCALPSHHTFDAQASVSIDQLHVTDPNPGNNSIPGARPSQTAITASADVKETGSSTSAFCCGTVGAPLSFSYTPTIHNNGPYGPVNADVTITLTLPPDCTTSDPNPKVVQDISLAMSTPVAVPASWQFVCNSPSHHYVSATSTVAIDQQHLTDPNPSNNGQGNFGSNTYAVSGTSDVKITATNASSPVSATAGSPFSVTGTATLHNNGAAGPTNVDTTLTLVGPSDCMIGGPNPATVDDTSLAISASTPVGAVWSVTCTDPSSHTFTINASTAIDQLHATDPDPGNNSRSNSSTTGVTASTDIKVSSATLSAPPAATGGSPFNVTATGTLHNNGPFGPANVDTTATLTMPTDCSTSSPNPATVQDTGLPVSAATPVNVTWSVTCTNASNHGFSASASTTVDQLHLMDTNTANDQAGASATTAIGATADLKVSALSVSSPGTFGAFAPFTVSASATLHNNGPSTPVNADSTISLTMPGDCTTSSTNPVLVNDTALPMSTATPIPASWSVTCTTPSLHTFSVSASTVLDALHSTDPNLANNSRGGSANTTIVPAKITVCKDVIPDDTTVWDFSATGPSPGNINDLADGQCAEFGSNMMPGSYTVDEDFQPGYAQSVDCGSNGFQNDGDITFTLDPGEQVTCQYVNAFHPGPNPVGGIAGLLDGTGGQDEYQLTSRDSERISASWLSIAVITTLTVGLGVGFSWHRLGRGQLRRR